MPEYINLPAGKNCILRLTHEEYLRGLRRGKAYRRRQAFEQRTAAAEGQAPRREGRSHGPTEAAV
jgi:hypothetical protein